MTILGIETSCDETAAAVLSFDSAQDEGQSPRIQILSNIVASSASLQAKYGGIIPEQAAREQIKAIIPVIEETLRQAFPKRRLLRPFGARNDEVGIDAIAVTYGPGLIGSLLVGVETAKVLATVWKKPLIPVNHLIGHFYANWIRDIATGPSDPRNDGFVIPSFPCIGLLVSGGHTDLVLFTDHSKYKYLGGTRDDAAGECFDKCARLLGLPYPGGPEIAKLATKGNPLKFNLPRPMIDSDDLDFSFSGLKTAVANLLHTSKVKPGRHSEHTFEVKCDLAASIEQAIIDPLVKKTILAAQEYKVNQIIVSGGVASNQKLVADLNVKCQMSNVKLFVPSPFLCTDNAAMITSAAFFLTPIKNPLQFQADPNLSLAY